MFSSDRKPASTPSDETMVLFEKEGRVNGGGGVVDPLAPSEPSSSSLGSGQSGVDLNQLSSSGVEDASNASNQQQQAFQMGKTQNLSNGKMSTTTTSTSDQSRPHMSKSDSLRIMDDVQDLEMTVASPASILRLLEKHQKQRSAASSALVGGEHPNDANNNNNNEEKMSILGSARRGATNDGNSLPSAEEARHYAASLLINVDRVSGDADKSPSGLHQAVPLVDSMCLDGKNEVIHSQEEKSGRHVLMKQIWRRSRRFLVILCLVILLIGAVSIFHRSGKDDSNVELVGTEGSPGGGNKDAGSQRFANIINFLVDHEISSTESLTVTDWVVTPQVSAVQWMANVDALQYPVPDVSPMDIRYMTNDELDSYERFIQRYVLTVLYYAMGGPEWNETLNFVTSTDECGWFFTKRFDQFVRDQYIMGVSCGMNLRVDTIFIPENNLQGEIPTEVGQLSSLEMLSFAGNSITGPIPATLDRLESMKYFDVRYNEMTGTIPDYAPNNWKKLQVLQLSNNYFAGSIPDNLGMELKDLRTLAIDDNVMTGTLDALYDATALHYLYCDRNLFSGMVDDATFMTRLSELREFDVSSNDLSSIDVFPGMHFFDPTLHPHLRVVDMAKNNFEGFVAAIPSNDRLQFLSIHGNALNGPLPQSISNLQALTHLDIEENMFTGSIPSDLGLLSELTYLFAGYNQYSLDELPPFVGDLTNLRELSIARSGIKSRINDGWIDALSNLTLLDLSENELYGAIPWSLWAMPNLQWIFLDHNQLTEHIPDLSEELQGGHRIEVLTLHRNLNVTGNADSFCDTAKGGVQQITLLATDCNVALQCDTTCCPSCCSPNEACFDAEITEYMTSIEGTWEHNYTRSSYSYDPDILSTSSSHTEDPMRNQYNQYDDTIEEDVHPVEGYFQNEYNNKHIPSVPHTIGIPEYEYDDDAGVVFIEEDDESFAQDTVDDDASSAQDIDGPIEGDDEYWGKDVIEAEYDDDDRAEVEVNEDDASLARDIDGPIDEGDDEYWGKDVIEAEYDDDDRAEVEVNEDDASLARDIDGPIDEGDDQYTGHEFVDIDEDDDDQVVDSVITKRYSDMVDFLIDNGISSSQSLMVAAENDTPQYDALLWMAHGDQLQYAVPDMENLTTEEDRLAYDRFVQRYVLAVLYYATHGPSWDATLNFVTLNDECAWFHKRQHDGDDYMVGVSCDADSRIRTIFIPENKMHGNIPTEIGQLSSLEMISLPGNRIMSTIPYALHKLENMLKFDVRYNEMTGSIPEFIPNQWKQLEVLQLSNNYFDGRIPDNLGTELSFLSTLAIDDNLMTGTLDALYDAIDLEYLYCDRNLFHATVDDSTFMTRLSKLRELDVSSNDLASSDVFPGMHFFDPAMHPNLRVLDMANNDFEGEILDDPTAIPSNERLQFLSIRGNALSGTVPRSISNLQGLTHLDIQDNQFTGSIPSEVGLLRDLTYLFVGYNPYDWQFQELPPFVEDLTNLREVSMAQSNLGGVLHGGWALALSNAIFIDLSENQLHGAIPSSWWNMPKLQWLFLDHNELDEEIPNLFTELRNGEHSLEVLTLHHNVKVTGNADSFCETAAGGVGQITLLATDCDDDLQCDTTTCCPSCCTPDEGATCFNSRIAEYMTTIEGTWEHNYTRSSTTYEPDSLAVSDETDPKRDHQNQYNDTIEEDVHPVKGYFESDKYGFVEVPGLDSNGFPSEGGGFDSNGQPQEGVEDTFDDEDAYSPRSSTDDW